jgi:hypothetical protein
MLVFDRVHSDGLGSSLGRVQRQHTTNQIDGTVHPQERKDLNHLDGPFDKSIQRICWECLFPIGCVCPVSIAGQH